MKLQATVVVPTHDHGPTLLRSVPSALAQTVDDLEVLIIGDGVPDTTRPIVDELMSQDRRVRFFDHPKGPRHGEIYRHQALEGARGEIVCYLADDDLWLPQHVETMRGLLRRADFAHALPLRVEPNGNLALWSIDWTLTYYRDLMLGGRNRVPLSCGAHTLKRYRMLPHGWQTTPRDLATDLFMWQQFLTQGDCRLASGSRPTVLHFASSQRTDWSTRERLDELDAWSSNLADPGWQQEFVLEVLDAVARDRARFEVQMTERVDTLQRTLQAAHQSITVRLRERIRHVPLAEPVLRSLAGILAGARAR